MKKFIYIFALSVLSTSFMVANSLDEGATNYSHFDDRIIFVEGGVEFAVFPDGHFDFNYINDPAFNSNVNRRIDRRLSFNAGYNYNPLVQYDVYGAVIQIEHIPVYYDAFGRVMQAGSISINYNNGFVNRIGNLNVFYNRGGIIHRTRGFINPFNRVYVYQNWHHFYGRPLNGRSIVWNSPYRRFYNPVRFGFNYHRIHWNNINYYNGCLTPRNRSRGFYRPADRVNYRSFERGIRNNRGRVVTNDRGRVASRAAIVSGRRTVDRGRSTAARTAPLSNTSARSVSTRSTRRSTLTSNNRRSTNSRSIATNRSNVRRTSTASVNTNRNRSTNVRNTRASRVNNRATNSNATRSNRITNTRVTANTGRSTAKRSTLSRRATATPSVSTTRSSGRSTQRSSRR